MKTIFTVLLPGVQDDYLVELGRGNKSRALNYLMKTIQPQDLGTALVLRITQGEAPDNDRKKTSVHVEASDLHRIKAIAQAGGLAATDVISLAIDYHRIKRPDTDLDAALDADPVSAP